MKQNQYQFVILNSFIHSNFSMYQIYPAMVPKNGTPEWEDFHKKYTLEAGDGRTPREQALWQLCALGVTIGMSIVGGIITGENEN